MFCINCLTIQKSDFPQNLKLADITPVYKKNDPLDKTNYRPISIFPVVSKIFERIMQKQINDFIFSFLSSYLCGYRKGFNTQHALLTLVENWRKSLNKGFGGAILMDLSKTFDTLNHDLLIAKLHAYGFQHDALKLLLSYHSKRWHRTKVNTSFRSWEELNKGVPEGSVLGPILFNLYLNDLFYLPEFAKVCKFADYTTFRVCDSDLKNPIKRLEHGAFLASEWFETNNMKLNKDKCHLLVSGHKYENVWVKMGDKQISEGAKQNLLGIEVGRNLNFDDHVISLCKKAGRKLALLARLSKFMSFKQKRILMKTFVESQFGYCPFIWMFHSRKVNSKINYLQERPLRIVYNDYIISFEDLLKKDNSFKIHHENIQSLVIELFKVEKGIAKIYRLLLKVSNGFFCKFC